MIDFSLTPEQEAIQKMARDFTEAEIIPAAAEYDRSGDYPREIVKKAFKAGLVYGPVPEKFGGGGLGALEQLIVAEELSAGCAGISACIAINSLAAMTTTAQRRGGDYVISGSKCFITNGGVADYYIVFATLDRSKGHRGITAFVVPRSAAGVTVGKQEEKMGQRAADTTDVIFDEVVVPEADRLGEEGEGFRIIMQTFNHSRPGVGASAVGVARRALDEAMQYALERAQFGMPIFMNQGIMFMLADMAKDIAAGRLLAWHAAWKADQGLDNSKEAAMAKVFCGDMVMRVTTDAVQIFGGYGYVKDYPVEKLMRDAKVFQIYEGTAQIQRLLIGRALAKEKMK